MATVVSAVAEASSTCLSTSRLCTPPVPRMSRELSSWPASTHGSSPAAVWLSRSASVTSSSLYGRDDLDLVAVSKQRHGPRTTRHDLTVDGGGDAGRGRRQPGDRLRHRGPAGQLSRLAVELYLDVHRDPPPAADRWAVRRSAVNRSGVNGSHSAAGRCPVRQATMASAVTGDIKMPLR